MADMINSRSRGQMERAGDLLNGIQSPYVLAVPSCNPDINELWQVAVPQVSSTTQLDGSCYSMNFREKTMDN
jgi:hypothetical protein